jgi:RNA polymerase sigma-70 factor (ECF subfamily)
MNYSSLSTEDLVRQCVRSEDNAAWEEFVRRFRPVIAGTVVRTARRFGVTSPDVIDDLIQDTYLKVCANDCRILREFEPRGPDAFFGLLKAVAFSVTHDHFKVKLAVVHGGGKAECPLDTVVQSTVADRKHLSQPERAILLRQIDEYLRSRAETADRDRWIFWLYYRHGMTGHEIAAIPQIGLSQKGVESVIQRLTTQVRTQLVEDALRRKDTPSL